MPSPRIRTPLDCRIKVERTVLPRAQDAPPLPTVGMGFRAFSATDKPPPNTMAVAAVMMGRPPSCFTFYQLYREIWGKVHTSTIMTSVTSHWATPRDVMVSASTYRCRPTRLVLEATSSFLGKDQPGEVCTPTTPDMVTARMYKCAYIQTNYQALYEDSSQGTHMPSSPSTL